MQHYFGTLKYGKSQMDAIEPASGNSTLQKYVFGEGANESYYSYEDLPSNKFASEATNLKTKKQEVVVTDKGSAVANIEVFKQGKDLINSVKENFDKAKAVTPEEAPNWNQIPFRDHGERKRLPEIKGHQKSWISVGMAGAGMAIETREQIYYSEKEKDELLKSGGYVPQNHTSKPYNLNSFPAAPSSLQNGDKKKGATGH